MLPEIKLVWPEFQYKHSYFKPLCLPAKMAAKTIIRPIIIKLVNSCFCDLSQVVIGKQLIRSSLLFMILVLEVERTPGPRMPSHLTQKNHQFLVEQLTLMKKRYHTLTYLDQSRSLGNVPPTPPLVRFSQG